MYGRDCLAIVAPIPTRLGPGMHYVAAGYREARSRHYWRRIAEERQHHDVLYPPKEAWKLGHPQPRFNATAATDALGREVAQLERRHVYVHDASNRPFSHSLEFEHVIVLTTADDLSAIGTPVSFPRATILAHAESNFDQLFDTLTYHGMDKGGLVTYEVDPQSAVEIAAFGYLYYGWIPR